MDKVNDSTVNPQNFFVINAVEYEDFSNRNSRKVSAEGENILLYVEQGNCLLDHAQEEMLLGNLQCVLIPAETSCTLYKNSEFCSIRLIHFQNDEVCAGKPATCFYLKERGFFATDLRYYEPMQEIIRDSKRKQIHELASASFHIKLQELILSICKQIDMHKYEQGSKALVYASVQWINKCYYYSSINVEKLAQKAKLGRWQYTKVFKQLTGKSPMQYVTDLRMKRARKILLSSKQRLQEIALSVGYQDEFYFSRRFKLQWGSPPIQYRKENWAGIRIAALTGVGEVLALGLKPAGVCDYLRLKTYKDQLCGVDSIGRYEPDYHKLTALNPDLILVSDYIDEAQKERMEKIAPIASIPHKLTGFERLKLIASLLGREQQAQTWFSNYEMKAAWLRKLVAPYIKPGETASFYYMWNGKIRMIHADILHPIFQIAGFSPTEKTKKMMSRNLWFEEVPVTHFHEYAGDRIFIVDDSASMQMSQKVYREQASKVQAYRENKVYYLDSSWYYGQDLISLNAQMEETAEMIRFGH